MTNNPGAQGHNARFTAEPLSQGAVKLQCDGILFDCDGVLVDSTTAGEAAWSRWADEYGLDTTHVLKNVHGRRSTETVSAHLPPHLREDGLRRIETIEIEGAAGTVAINGAAALLTQLPENWAVVTSATTNLVRVRLRAAGLPCPPVLITGDDVGRGKPAPDGYLEAARRLGLDPGACIVAEDSVTGVRAGQASGARLVLGIGNQALESTAHLVVQDLSGVRWTGRALQIPRETLLRGHGCAPQTVH